MRSLTRLSLVLCACCHPNPKIKAFHVTPAGYCPSGKQQIHLDWDTEKGDTTLQVYPDDPAPRKVDARGSTDFPAHDVTVTLTVNSGELHPHVIQPVRAVDRHPLNALATDVGGGKCDGDWMTADGSDFGGGSNAFAPDAHPSIISNRCDPHASATATCRRNVKVEHAGHTWRIGPDSVVDVMTDAAPMAGKWFVSQQLLPGEQCGTQSALGAVEVDLSLEIDCAKGTAYEQ